MIAIVGGSGTEALYRRKEELDINTPFGKATVYLLKEDVYLLLRHGRGHKVPPHMINYKANIWALKEMGTRGIIATNAVGSLIRNVKPGSFVIPHDFLDFTKSRSFTFYDDKVVHTDMTKPYDEEVRRAIIRSAKKLNLNVVERGVYVATEGPRYETPAEIKMFRRLGGTVVGMTGVPEVTLAKEVGIKYASLCVVTNYAAGMQKRISHSEVIKLMEVKLKEVKKIIDGAIEVLLEKWKK